MCAKRNFRATYRGVEGGEGGERKGENNGAGGRDLTNAMTSGIRATTSSLFFSHDYVCIICSKRSKRDRFNVDGYCARLIFDVSLSLLLFFFLF